MSQTASRLLESSDLDIWLAERGLPSLQRLRYRRVKPGTSTVLGLDLVDGPAFLVRWDRPDPGKIGKYLRRTPDSVLHHEDRVLLARLPADRHLPGLRLHPDLVAAATTLSYKPMRRWVGRRADTVLRVYAADGSTGDRHRVVASAVPGTARIRRVLSDDTLEVDHLPGSPLPPSGDWRPVGQLLRGWHRVELPPTAPPVRTPDWVASARLAAFLLPDRAERIERVLAGVRVPADHGTSLCHGDLSPDQVLTGPALLDLDHAGRGSAAWDLASWWATAPEPARSGLLDGYGLGPQLADQPSAVLRLLPAVCLGRSTEAFRTCRPDWPGEVDRLLDLAEQARTELDAR